MLKGLLLYLALFDLCNYNLIIFINKIYIIFYAFWANHKKSHRKYRFKSLLIFCNLLKIFLFLFCNGSVRNFVVVMIQDFKNKIVQINLQYMLQSLPVLADLMSKISKIHSIIPIYNTLLQILNQGQIAYRISESKREK